MHRYIVPPTELCNPRPGQFLGRSQAAGESRDPITKNQSWKCSWRHARRVNCRRHKLHLYFLLATDLIQQQGAANFFHAQAHVPAQPSPPLEDARLSPTNEDEERAGGPVAPSRQRTQAGFGEAGLPRITILSGAPGPDLMPRNRRERPAAANAIAEPAGSRRRIDCPTSACGAPVAAC